ncbi:MAG: META domain-containing protein [Sporichthyaceae bacterium]
MRARTAVALAGALLLAAGCSGGGEERFAAGLAPGDRAGVPAADTSTPLRETTWQLETISKATGVVFVRPDLDITFRIDDQNRFVLRGCNDVVGPVRLSGSALWLDGEAHTFWTCSGEVASSVDALLLEFADGARDWEVTGEHLVLTAPEQATSLRFRVLEDAPPPIDTLELGELAAGSLRCRPIVGNTGQGLRLWVLTPTRPDGPWRLIPTGPAAPGEPPILSRRLENRAAGRSCVAGLAPAGTASVSYRAHPAAAAESVPVHAVPGTDLMAYAGIVERRDTGKLTAIDAEGRKLVAWPTRR